MIYRASALSVEIIRTMFANQVGMRPSQRTDTPIASNDVSICAITRHPSSRVALRKLRVARIIWADRLFAEVLLDEDAISRM